MINDEKLEHDIQELTAYVEMLSHHMSMVKDPSKYKKMVSLKRDALAMIHDLEERKLLNKEI